MTNLRRSFFWAASYLAIILVLGQADYIGKPIINFASYFYLVTMIGIPVTLFFPGNIQDARSHIAAQTGAICSGTTELLARFKR